MPKKTTTESGEQPTAKAIRIPSESAKRAFNSASNDYTDAKDEAKEQFDQDKSEATKKHVVVKPFNLCKDLHDSVKNAKNESLAAEKLATFLAHFDDYRKFFKLDELANLQGRMFPVGEMGEASDDKPPRATDEDGEPDMRPDHLRQPGASAASVVQDLAAKAGAKTSDGDDPIDQVGRGKPH